MESHPSRVPRSWERYPTRSRPLAFTRQTPASSCNGEKWRTDAVAAAAKDLPHSLTHAGQSGQVEISSGHYERRLGQARAAAGDKAGITWIAQDL